MLIREAAQNLQKDMQYDKNESRLAEMLPVGAKRQKQAQGTCCNFSKKTNRSPRKMNQPDEKRNQRNSS